MREKLKQYNYKFKNFTATVGEGGTYKDKSKKGITICLKNVKTGDEILTDHVWVDFNPFFKQVKRGDVIKFRSKVKVYYKHKGIKDYCFDWWCPHTRDFSHELGHA